jgi:hypothetical protein
VPAVAAQLVHQLAEQQPADAGPADRRRDREVEQLQPGAVQLVDHEPDDRVPPLGHHADAVPLPQAAEEVVLGPGELEAGEFDRHHVGHVPADHPPDVDRVRVRVGPLAVPAQRAARAHERTPPRSAAVPPHGRRAKSESGQKTEIRKKRERR